VRKEQTRNCEEEEEEEDDDDDDDDEEEFFYWPNYIPTFIQIIFRYMCLDLCIDDNGEHNVDDSPTIQEKIPPS
jgi:hypothetical protein